MGKIALEEAPSQAGVKTEEKATRLKENFQLEEGPENRRTRKRLQKSSTWLVRWDPEGLERKHDLVTRLDGCFDAVIFNVNHMVSFGGHPEDVWDVLALGAKFGKVSAVMVREGPASQNRHGYQAKVHLLHGMSVLGRAKNAGSWTGGLFYSRTFRGIVPCGIARWDEMEGLQ